MGEINLFSEYLLPVVLAVITLGMGLSIELNDFKNTFIHPKAVITGLISQMVILPIIGFILSFIPNIDPSFKVGLILISASPGGATANLVIFMLMGNLALAVSITIINSILTLFTTPLLVRLGLIAFMGRDTLIHLPYMQTLINLFLIIILPAFIGVLIRHYFPEFAKGMERPLRYILPVILLAVYLGVILIDKSDNTASLKDYIHIFYYTLILNCTSMLAGYTTGAIVRLDNKDRYTIAIQTGLQNSTLAIFIAATLLNDQMMAITPIIYGSFTFFSTWFIGFLMKTYGEKKAERI